MSETANRMVLTAQGIRNTALPAVTALQANTGSTIIIKHLLGAM